jgi:hypothetical protein
MTTEIKEVSNPHFEWQMEEGVAVKKILSEKIITKKVIITYDDEGVEVNREYYGD